MSVWNTYNRGRNYKCILQHNSKKIVRPLFTIGWLQMLLLHTCKKAGGRYIFLVEKQRIIRNIMGYPDKNVTGNQGKSHWTAAVLCYCLKCLQRLLKCRSRSLSLIHGFSEQLPELSGLVCLAQVLLSRAAPPPVTSWPMHVVTVCCREKWWRHQSGRKPGFYS